MRIFIPEFALVLLVGPAGSGKSTFARRHFRATEIVSSDACRAQICDDESDQRATRAAFELVHLIVDRRLSAAKLSVVDATNVQPQARRALLDLARAHDCAAVAIVFDLPAELCLERCQGRERRVDAAVIQSQAEQLRRSLYGLRSEGFRQLHVLRAPDLDRVLVKRQRLWSNRRDERGPFDLIGDVHGCARELELLLARLGYAARLEGAEPVYRHPDGRRAIFLGDLVDRGPDIPGVLRVVMNMVEAGSALCVAGNHEAKLLKKLSGRNVRLAHGLVESVAQLSRAGRAFEQRVARFLDRLDFHYVLDDGKLVVAHAGMREALQGRTSGRVREFALYGDTTGEVDELGFPVRRDWARDYAGEATVVYGHTPVAEPKWVNNTLCIDTGCVFGGKLTALRYPERTLVAVPAARVYCASATALGQRSAAAEASADAH